MSKKNATKSPGRSAKPAGRPSPQAVKHPLSRLTPGTAARNRSAKVMSKLGGGTY